MMALGLIETKGLLGAIEGADAMLKAADVRLLEKTCVGGGLVTIIVTGEVAAVKASVDAAAAAIMRVSGATLVSEHVIPRPYPELEGIIIPKPPSDDDETKLEKIPESKPEPEQKVVKTEQLEKNDSFKKIDDAEISREKQGKLVLEHEVAAQVQKKAKAHKAHSKAESPRHEISQLKKMNVSKLRRIARTFEGFTIARKEIKFARKKELIEAIMNTYRQE